MKVLGSAVLTMEVFVMGFAMLLAKDIHEPATIIYGFAFMLVTIATVRLLKKKIGWIIGSILQFALMAYSVVVPAMAIVNLIFMALWVAAIIVGRKGEAARATLLSQGPPKP